MAKMIVLMALLLLVSGCSLRAANVDGNAAASGLLIAPAYQ